jgi:hypothetical protein
MMCTFVASASLPATVGLVPVLSGVASRSRRAHVVARSEKASRRNEGRTLNRSERIEEAYGPDADAGRPKVKMARTGSVVTG